MQQFEFIVKVKSKPQVQVTQKGRRGGNIAIVKDGVAPGLCCDVHFTGESEVLPGDFRDKVHMLFSTEAGQADKIINKLSIDKKIKVAGLFHDGKTGAFLPTMIFVHEVIDWDCETCTLQPKKQSKHERETNIISFPGKS